DVLGFLTGLLGDPERARDALAQASADLWSGLPAFRGRASARTWFYKIARHAASRLRRSPAEQPRRRVAIDDVSELEAAVRTTTAPYLRTDVKDGFTAIREALAPDDRALLLLRVDRRMSWREIARVMAGDGPDDSELELERAAVRLRKHFQVVKEE